MTLYATLISGTQALRAFQLAMQTTSHNITNANTPGYSRQRVDLSTVIPDAIEGGFFLGRGVRVDGISRIKDVFVEAQVRAETSGFGQSAALERTYTVLESIFHEQSNLGLSTSMSEFWDAWHELSNNPTDIAVRAELRARAQTLSDTFKRLDNGLTDLSKSINADLRSEVSHINSLAKDLAQVNKQIREASVQRQTPNDLFDERERLVKEISSKINVATVLNERGDVKVHIQGMYLVDERGANEIEARPQPASPIGSVDLFWADSGLSVEALNGSLKGLIDSRDTIVVDYQSRLNSLAQTIIQQVNTTHRQGTGLDGSVSMTGVFQFVGTIASNSSFDINGTTISIFSGDDLVSIMGRINAETATTGVTASISNSRLVLSPGGVTPQTVDITADPDNIMSDLGFIGDFFKGSSASDMGISDLVATDLKAIAASQSGAPGDNSNAIALSALRDAFTMTTGSQSFDDFYRGLITDLGSEAQSAVQVRSNQGILLEQLDSIEASVSGVNLDEEMTNLLKFQKSYEMVARVIQTTDEMLDALLSI